MSASEESGSTGHGASGRGWRLPPDESRIVTENLHNVFLLLYAHVPDYTEEDWAQEGFLEYAANLRDHVLRQVRGLGAACEARGINSAPLGEIGTKWAGLWRAYPDPRQALEHVREYLPDDWVVERLNATTQRLQRIADVEREDAMAEPAHGIAGHAHDVTASESPVAAPAADPPTQKAPSLDDQMVTLDQAAAISKRSKRTLEKDIKHGRLPRADNLGGGGKASYWYWHRLRPELQKLTAVRLPEVYPDGRILRQS